jgi:GxxExxY protein
MDRGAIEPDAELDELAHRTIGAAIEVHRRLGPGFLESIYEEALCVELATRGLSCERQVPIDIVYRGRAIGQFRLDLVVGARLIVELKTVPQLLPIHIAQLVSYLKAFREPVGILLNFHVSRLQSGIRRVVVSGGYEQGLGLD